MVPLPFCRSPGSHATGRDARSASRSRSGSRRTSSWPRSPPTATSLAASRSSGATDAADLPRDQPVAHPARDRPVAREDSVSRGAGITRWRHLRERSVGELTRASGSRRRAPGATWRPAIDPRSGEPRREAKSVSAETTLRGRYAADLACWSLIADGASARRSRAPQGGQGSRAGASRLKLKTRDFRTHHPHAARACRDSVSPGGSMRRPALLLRADSERRRGVPADRRRGVSDLCEGVRGATGATSPSREPRDGRAWRRRSTGCATASGPGAVQAGLAFPKRQR